MSKLTNIDSHTDFMFYRSEDGTTNIKVIVEDDNTWVTQAGMAEIFGTSRENVTMHLKNIFEGGELDEFSTSKESLQVRQEGSRQVRRSQKYYNLDAIISVGYRVNSYQATQFRIWASKVLKEYMLKGFALDDDRLKQGKQLFGKDYFDELLERIREIRASERRFYQKVTEIYIQCSYDYDKSSPISQQFFAHAQNKLEYAVVGMTAAEIIAARADHNLAKMGLTAWKGQKDGGKIYKYDITVAKNYLSEEEISDLNRLVNMFLDYAETQARKKKKLSMQDWHEKLDSFLQFNEYEILENYGSISKEAAKLKASLEYEKFKPLQDAEYTSDFDKAVEHMIKNSKKE